MPTPDGSLHPGKDAAGLNHSLGEGHLGCFQFLTVMNKAAVNISGVDVCLNLSFHMSRLKRSKAAGPCGNCMFIRNFSRVALPFYSPTIR